MHVVGPHLFSFRGLSGIYARNTWYLCPVCLVSMPGPPGMPGIYVYVRNTWYLCPGCLVSMPGCTPYALIRCPRVCSLFFFSPRFVSPPPPVQICLVSMPGIYARDVDLRSGLEFMKKISISIFKKIGIRNKMLFGHFIIGLTSKRKYLAVF